MSVSQEENVKLDTPWHYLIKHSDWLVGSREPTSRQLPPQNREGSGAAVADRWLLVWQNTFAKLLSSTLRGGGTVMGGENGRKIDVVPPIRNLFFVWDT